MHIHVRGHRIKVCTVEESETALLVCADLGECDTSDDNVEAECVDCHRPLDRRPHSPAHLIAICAACMRLRPEMDEGAMITWETYHELKALGMIDAEEQ